MKKGLLRVVFFVVFLFGMLGSKQWAAAQNATFTANNSGLPASYSTYTSGEIQKGLLGFSVSVTGGSITFTKFDNISFSIGSSQSYLANGTLYRSTSSSFNQSSPGTPVGNVTFNGGNITVDRFTETISSASPTPTYYFLAADVINTGNQQAQIFINTGNFATDAGGSSNYQQYSNYQGINFVTGTPYPLIIQNNTTDLTPAATMMTASYPNAVVLSFSVRNNTGSAYTLSQLNINSNLSPLSNYFSNARLLASTNNALPPLSGAISGTVSTTSGYATFTGLSQSIAAGTTRYFWFVVNRTATSYAGVTAQFNISARQSNNSIVASTPSANYNTGTAFGYAYTINTAVIDVDNTGIAGLSSTTVYPGQTNVAVFGFRIRASSGTSTISGFNINSNNTSLGTYYGTPRLYPSASATFNSASPGTAIGSALINGSTVEVSGLSEAMTTTYKYYFLVVNVSYSGTGTNGTIFRFASGQSPAAVVQSAPASGSYNTFSVPGSQYNITQPTISVQQQTGNLQSPTALNYGQSGAVFGFSINVTGVATVSQINLNVDNNTIAAQSLVTATLYRAASGTYNSSSPGTPVGSVSIGNNSLTVNSLTENFTNGQTNYYFLVANNIYASYTADDAVRFNMNTSNAVVSSGGINVNPNFNGTKYTINKRTVAYTFTSANAAVNGITQGIIYPGQTGVVAFGVGISSDVNATISGFILNAAYNNGNPQFYFENATAKLYSSTSSTFSTTTAQLLNTATVSFGSGTSPGVTISNISEGITSTIKYFFLVVNLNYNFNTVTGSTGNMQFKFETSQTNAITQTAPLNASVPAASAINGNVFTIDPPSLAATGANAAVNGITPGVLSYGQTDIVMFGFRLTVTGVLKVAQFDFQATMGGGADINQTFTNGRVYRSTDQYFSHASLVSGTTVSFNGSSAFFITGLNQSLNSTTGAGSYYYFIVGDYPTTQTNAQGGSMKIQFNNGSQTAVSDPYKVFTNLSVTDGKVFTIATTYKWTGSVAGQETNVFNAGNFLTLNNNGVGASPFANGSAAFVTIGNVTNYPVVGASTEVGGISFTSANAKITVSAGTLTVNGGLNVTPGSTANIVGAGAISLGANSASYVSSTGIIKLTGDAKINNNSGGIFTLKSDANGSATVDQLSGSAAFTGTYNTERYVAGGAGKRTYRLMSAPVYQTTVAGQRAYGFTDLQNTTPITGYGATGTYSATPPGSAFDNSAAGNPSILYYHEPDPDPSSAVISRSDYKGLKSISEKFLVGNGFLFFFRGNRSYADNSGNLKVSTTAVPENTTLNFTGALNQGTINVYIPTNPIVTSGANKVYETPTSAANVSTNFSYTNNLTNPTTPSPNNGYHLVGNPYPATIDLEGITLNNPGSTSVYMLNNSGVMSAYVKGSNSTTLVNGVGRYVLTGQGFMVKSNTSGTTTLSFSETAKRTSGITTPTTFAIGKTDLLTAANGGSSFSAPTISAIQSNSLQAQSSLKVALELDSTTVNETLMLFDANGKNKFDDFEDAYYRNGITQTIFMASYTADNQPCLINHMGRLDSIKSVKLYAEGQITGIYKLKFSGASTIDPRFKPILKDSFKGDSLDLSANETYSFNIDRGNPKTYGSERFTIVFRPTGIAKLYNLLSFTATKESTGALLKWKTEYEGNYTGFTLQRSTDNWKTTTSLTSLQSNGTGVYNFIDNNPEKGVNEYRLVQNNIDNAILTSNIVSVSYLTINAQTNKLQVYPNPVKTDINIGLEIDKNASLVVRIYNITGILVKAQKFSPGSSLSLNVGTLIDGTYMIEVADSEGKHYGSTTFIKI